MAAFAAGGPAFLQFWSRTGKDPRRDWRKIGERRLIAQIMISDLTPNHAALFAEHASEKQVFRSRSCPEEC
jgi:hypothetical protein